MSTSVPCPQCGEPLRTPLGCQACGALLPCEPTPNPFEVFGREPGWEVEPGPLKKQLLELARLCHPDFHGLANSARQHLAEQHSALVNHSHEVLARPFLRADWLLQHLGGPTEKEERQMPQAFLMEVMEWNEQMDDASQTPPASPEREALKALTEQLSAERTQHLESIGSNLTPLPAPGAPILTSVRRELNAVRYLSRALWRIRDLRLAESLAQ
ncbi:MAG: DnaJ-domain-containing protein 1 [Planctomycetota bacterium]